MLDKLKSTFSIQRQLKSFGYAFKGIAYVMKNESNMHIHLLAAFFVIVAACVFGVSSLEWCLLIFAIVLVWVAETLNTSIELLTDLVSPDYHPLAGKAKDVAAGAVTLAAVGAAIIGSIIFLPKIVAFFSNF